MTNVPVTFQRMLYKLFSVTADPVPGTRSVLSKVHSSHNYRINRKMVTKLHVEGFEAFMTEVDNHSNKDLYVLFCGSRDHEGKSWCPDCVVGKSRVIYTALCKVCFKKPTIT